MPSGTVDAGEFRYANELVAFIRETTGDWFHIDVAAYPEMHPQAGSPERDQLPGIDVVAAARAGRTLVAAAAGPGQHQRGHRREDGQASPHLRPLHMLPRRERRAAR